MGIEGELRIVVCMCVDDTRRNDVAIRFDHPSASGVAPQVTDRGNPTALDRHIRAAARETRAVDDDATADHQVVGHWSPPLLVEVRLGGSEQLAERCVDLAQPDAGERREQVVAGREKGVEHALV